MGNCPHPWTSRPHCNQFIISSKTTACGTTKNFAVQAEMVAVETIIDVGNILWIFYDFVPFKGTFVLSFFLICLLLYILTSMLTDLFSIG